MLKNSYVDEREQFTRDKRNAFKTVRFSELNDEDYSLDDHGDPFSYLRDTPRDSIRSFSISR